MNYEDKVYEYEGKIYCEEDRSMELGDRWGGDLYELFFLLEREGKCSSHTVYCGEEHAYDSHEELLAEEFGSYEVRE